MVKNEKQLEYWRNWYKRNPTNQRERVKRRVQSIRKWYSDYKKTLKCSKCDETETCCLEFHHKNRKKKEINISNAIANGWGKERIKKEIVKCIVVCANCHRKIHANKLK